MGFVVVIPARYASTRLPGKPLLDIAGKPMLQHVYERACDSGAEAVHIATDDERIAEAARRFTDAVCMTSDSHQSGTDRIEEVARQLSLADDAIVVNVQGDEPLIPPGLIDQVAEDLKAHEEAGISSLCEPIAEVADMHNPNIVKVVMDAAGYALYFSRSLLPWRQDQQHLAPDTAPVYRHIGIYAYRVATLKRFVSWPPAMLERSERLEQLRALSYGVRIHMQSANEEVPGGIDTPEDLERLRDYFRKKKGEWSD